jgi:Ca2+-binding RTX toxin-like protein
MDMLVSTTGNPVAADGSTTPENMGSVYLVYGKTDTSNVRLTALGSQGFRIDGQVNVNDFFGTGLGGAGDINGDGFDDIVIGAVAPEVSPSALNAGATYVVYGGSASMTRNVFQTSNGDRIGTSGNDLIDGTSGNNQLVGGNGDDVITGNGGFDVMYGGRGNDTFVLNADNVAKLSNSGSSQAISRIDGGTGIDTLRLDGAGITLDFTQLTGAPVKNVERIDLTGSGNNTVRLTLTDVLDLGSNNTFNVNPAAVDTRKQLQVQGDAGDRVVLTDVANWTQLTGANSTFVDGSKTYNVWNHNTSGAQLLIDQALGTPTAS